MSNGFTGFEIARSGLMVNERALYVTGHNISNVNTPGYVRQQLMTTTGPVQTTQGKNSLFQYGMGADVQQIRQIRHSFLDNIYRQENTTYGYWNGKAEAYTDIEAILAEPMEPGLQDAMNQFWDSWQELSKEPDSLTVRALVRQRADSLVNHINHMGSQLDKLQDDLNSEIKLRIEEVNSITRQISNLNMQILKAENTGDTANDYRDQRNYMVDRLSGLIDCKTYEMPDGQMDITAAGYYLVSRSKALELSAEEKITGGIFYVPKIKGTNIEIPLNSGEIKGLMEARGEVMGAEGSPENGSPVTKADIVIAVDISDSSGSYLANVKSNIEQYVEQLDRWGVDYNLRLITFGDNVISHTDFGTDAAALALAIPAIPSADTGNNFGGAGGVLEELEAIADFRNNAKRFALVFTGESPDGDGGLPAGADYTDRLNALDINTSVITDSTWFGGGDPVGENGWEWITEATGGGLYDINTAPADYETMMMSVSDKNNSALNSAFSYFEYTGNTLADLRQSLNSVINIMARQVNYIHQQGKTLSSPPLDGEDFFTVINSNYPLEMGNIKLNDNLSVLNNIAASMSGDGGDNIIALKIADLRHKQCISDTTGILSIDDYYRAIILKTGNDANNTRRIADNQHQLVLSADQQRSSIAGVSMDEEMANMMKYKFAYNAASKVINVMDDLLNTIINRMGLAGG